jgi:hypothetical protein
MALAANARLFKLKSEFDRNIGAAIRVERFDKNFLFVNRSIRNTDLYVKEILAGYFKPNS